MQNKPMPTKVHFILTGGTIDSYYDGALDTVVTNKESVIPQYIKTIKLYADCEFTQVCMKDSRNLTREDLANLVKAVEQSPHKHIIIAHGTYTMPDTGRLLAANMKSKGKVVILTGSLIPLSNFAFSDAGFNLGYAMGQLAALEPGVYVCMHGKVFDPAEIAKMLSEGRFISIFGER